MTTGVAANFLAQTLTQADLSGLMAHEVGHQALGATRFTLVTVWLAAPWRVATRVVVGVGRGLSGRLLAALVVTTVVLAVVQSVQRDQSVVAAVLVTLALCGMVCPLADAALSRRDELAADRYAAHAGVLSGDRSRTGDTFRSENCLGSAASLCRAAHIEALARAVTRWRPRCCMRDAQSARHVGRSPGTELVLAAA